jgi:hypothetical protein
MRMQMVFRPDPEKKNSVFFVEPVTFIFDVPLGQIDQERSERG